MQQLILGDITVDIIQKNIKNIHLRIYPITGRVRISAPYRMNIDSIRIFAISKLGWIKKQQTKLRNQEREIPREFVSNESHYYQGKRYLLQVIEHNAPPKVVLKHDIIELYIRPDTSTEKRRSIIYEWYREKLREAIPPYIDKWEKIMRVKVNEFAIKRMKTRWGTCNRKAKRIWLNLELEKKPPQLLEYIIVHEMTHLLERHHNDRFIALMDKFLPQWKIYKEELNRLPITHVY